MKKATVTKLVLSIIGGAFISVVAFHTLGSLLVLPHTFIGTKQFPSMSEMQEFQTELVEYTIGRGGTVSSFNLTVSSPPTVDYCVYIPNAYEFKYGKQAYSTSFIISMIGFLSMMCFVVIMAFLLSLWSSHETSDVLG